MRQFELIPSSNFTTILLLCRTVKLKLGINNDVSIFTKVGSWFKGNSKKHKQTILAKQQHTFKDEEGKAHDIMLIKLNEDMSAKLPTISLPSGECTKLEQNTKVDIGGMGSKGKGKNIKKIVINETIYFW